MNYLIRLLKKLRRSELQSLASTSFPYQRSKFDAKAYLDANPDVASAGVDPWYHFVRNGHGEGRRFTSLSGYANSVNDEDVYAKVMSSGFFDPDWYVDRYPDLISSGIRPLKHFCDYGVWEGRDPGPNFSTSWYFDQYPDTQGLNPVLHYTEYGLHEGRTACPPQGIFEAIEKAYEGIRAFDIDLQGGSRNSWWKSVPIVDGRTRNLDVKIALRNLLAKFDVATKRLILVPWCIHSGSDVVAANILRAANKILGADSIAIVIVDFDRIEALDWLPENYKIVNFAAETNKMSLENRRSVLEKLIMAIGPDACLNVNSYLAWELFKNRGGALSTYTRLYGCIFCPDYNEHEVHIGYSHTHLLHSLPYLQGVISDNVSFRNELEREFGLLPEDVSKFLITHQPVRAGGDRSRLLERVSRGPRLNVLWAGRISRQKNYKLLAEIIALAPSSFHFWVYGSGDEVSVSKFHRLIAGRKNVTVCGSYKGFEWLPLETFDAYLYTSLWDGLPNAVLEAGAYAFPVVASNVGGVGEVIQRERGWLIEDIDNPEQYIAALQEILENREAAHAKGERLRRYISTAHSWERFCEQLSGPGQFLGE